MPGSNPSSTQFLQLTVSAILPSKRPKTSKNGQKHLKKAKNVRKRSKTSENGEVPNRKSSAAAATAAAAAAAVAAAAAPPAAAAAAAQKVCRAASNQLTDLYIRNTISRHLLASILTSIGL